MKKLVPFTALLIGLSVAAAEITYKTPAIPAASMGAIPPPCWPSPVCPAK